MFRVTILAMLTAFVAACSTEPVGGRGPFDPLPTRPGPVTQRPQPVIVTPPAPNPLQQGQTQIPDAGQIVVAGDPQPIPTGDLATSPTGIGIDPNAQSIDLNATSQAQQKLEREEDARRLAEARARLQVINPEAVEQVDPDANVALFARSTKHEVGTRVYQRSGFASRSQSSRVCGRFGTSDEAQRQFLANGGPQRDRFNLDPDGDGFACKFDPTPYRQLSF